MGQPKALVDDWLVRGVSALRDGGCAGVYVVLGAEFELAVELVPEGVSVVRADDWAAGMGASLRAGLSALESTDADAALVTLVDLPDVGGGVVSRLVAELLAPQPAKGRLARAAYAGKPGHPVLIGRDHWAGVRDSAEGDQGARSYLAAHDVESIECGDLATGRDQDYPRDS